MKFYCDACNTKYAISDEKVRGKILRVRCKNCGNIVSVREAVAPISAVPAAKTDPNLGVPSFAATPAVPANNWFYALNGQTFGPFTLEGLQRKYASAEIGDATYVWHQQMGAWKPVATEPIFADSLAMGHKIVPSRKTLGFTGPVEAVRLVKGGPSKERKGVAPNRAHAKSNPASPPPRPKPVQAQAPPPEAVRSIAPRVKTVPPTPEARPIKDVRKGNLEKLRASLGTSLGGDGGPEPLPQPVAGEAMFTFADGVTPASAQSSQELVAAMDSDAFDFDLPPKATSAKPSPSSRSDILERVIGPTEDPPSEAVDDSGIIPFFPEASQLGGAHAASVAQDVTSESLLIDISSMKKKGRKNGFALGLIGAIVGLVLLVVAVTVAVKREEPKVTQPAAGQQQGHKADLVMRTYTKGDVSKIATMDLEDELLFTEEEANEGEDPAEGSDTMVAALAKGSSAKLKKPKTMRSRTKAATVSEKAPEEPVDPVEQEPVDPLAQLLKQRAGRTPSINAPPDKLLQKNQKGLSKDQARRGFQKVKRSIRDCRERHNRYNAKLDAGKLKVSVTVEPGGAVSKFNISPSSVQNTEFYKCMTSHRGRWRFAKFSGKPVVINTSVIIQ